MAGSIVLSSAATAFNQFTSTKSLYAMEYRLGLGITGNPVIDPATPSTYRWAIAMPSLGFLQNAKVFFESQTGGLSTGTIDFRLFSVPWDEPTRHPQYDCLFEMRQILLGTMRESRHEADPLSFANRVGYIGTDPSGNKIASPRNFLWMEIKPNDATSVAPIVRVHLFLEV